MMDEQVGTSFSYRGGSRELVHEELALPDRCPGLAEDCDQRAIGQQGN